MKAVQPRKFKLLLKAITLEPVELLKLVLIKVTFELFTITVTPTESVLGSKRVYVQFKKLRLETTKCVDSAKIPNCLLQLTTVLPVFDPVKVKYKNNIVIPLLPYFLSPTMNRSCQTLFLLFMYFIGIAIKYINRRIENRPSVPFSSGCSS